MSAEDQHLLDQQKRNCQDVQDKIAGLLKRQFNPFTDRITQARTQQKAATEDAASATDILNKAQHKYRELGDYLEKACEASSEIEALLEGEKQLIQGAQQSAETAASTTLDVQYSLNTLQSAVKDKVKEEIEAHLFRTSLDMDRVIGQRNAEEDRTKELLKWLPRP